MTSEIKTRLCKRSSTSQSGPISRRSSVGVLVGNVIIGAGNPIVVQSMTNTDTADIDSTVSQIESLSEAGSEIVRIAVDRNESAASVAHIRDRLAGKGLEVPLVGDFHYNGHQLLRDYPSCAEALSKYRINPGNVGFRHKRDAQFSLIVEQAILYDKPVRIGVNWGSLDQELLAHLMDENKETGFPLSSQEVLREAIVSSGLSSAERAQEIGLSKNKIVISAKVSKVQELIAVYNLLAKSCDYALHLGLTEAGIGLRGLVASSSAIGILLQQGIGDTIRYSLTPEPGGDRSEEVIAAQTLLQTMGLRSFVPSVTSCPGCGRTNSTKFVELANQVKEHIRASMPEWRDKYPGVENLDVAVMGCIVNGPGESKHADIGISLPGTGEAEIAPVFADGEKIATLRGSDIASQFTGLLEDYIAKRFGDG